MRKTVKFGAALALVALFVVFCFASLPVVGFAEEQTATKTYDVGIETFVKDLCDLNAVVASAKGDTAKDAAKENVRKFIVNTFRVALGEAPISDETSDATQETVSTEIESVEAESKVKEIYFGKKPNSYYNIEAKLEGKDTSKQIIIGAHYDVDGVGAGDNVCGVAVLYQTLKTLASHRGELPFNVVFVAFDGEEDGLLGSTDYVNSRDFQKSNTLVMFNVDSIALGENLYLMCENKSTDLAKLILSNSSGIKEKPYARGTYNELDYSFGYGYYEFVQGSDHTPFRLSGTPVAVFFSGNYSLAAWNFDYGDIINGENDTYDNLKKYDFVGRIQTVSGAIVNTMLSDKFVTVAANAKSQLVNLDFWYNALWPTLVVVGILVVLAVLAILYNIKLQKKAILGAAEIKNKKVFDKPAAEEIFSFKDEEGKQNGDNVDDIFTFKK